MQPLRIVIDVRHIKDFGIGTYIRNLVKALGELDQENQYLLVGQRTPMFPICRACPATSKRLFTMSRSDRNGTTSHIPGF